MSKNIAGVVGGGGGGKCVGGGVGGGGDWVYFPYISI